MEQSIEISIFALIDSIGKFILSAWWLWLVLILWVLFFSVWNRWRRHLFLQEEYYTLIEVKISREIIKGPKAMEAIFANVNGLVNAPDSITEKYWLGEVTHWFSFEMVSTGGDIQFYIYLPKRHQSMVEAHIYAQYPDVEITESAQDYTSRFPSHLQDLYDTGYDMWGSELQLVKEDVYPIRTYVEFESSEDAQNLDPISALIENLAKAKQNEHLWVQIVIRPVMHDWEKKGKKIVEKLKNQYGQKKVVIPAMVEGDKDMMRMTMQRMSPGEVEILEAIERNIAKPAFETVIRYLYIAPRKGFNTNFGKRAVFSSLSQYKSQTLNHFKRNRFISTQVYWTHFPYFFPKKRLNARKARLLLNYKTRYIPEDPVIGKLLTSTLFFHNFHTKRIVLNAEELATIYHYPTMDVLTAPFIQRVESRKTGPPAGLAIFSDEDPGFTFGDAPPPRPEQPA